MTDMTDRDPAPLPPGTILALHDAPTPLDLADGDPRGEIYAAVAIEETPGDGIEGNAIRLSVRGGTLTAIRFLTADAARALAAALTEAADIIDTAGTTD